MTDPPAGEIRAVIFDLDDTLYPERSYVFSGFAAVAAAFADLLGDATAAARDMRRFFDPDRRSRVFNALLAERGVDPDPELIDRLVAIYRAHAPTIQLRGDADAALSRLGGRYQLGVITDGPPVQQRAKIDALGLADRVERIIVTGELGSGFAKPHPRAFEMMAASLAVDARRCVYVADNAAKDFIAPNALGWMTIQVRRPDGIYRETPAPPGGAPRFVVEMLDEIDRLL